MSSAPPPHPPRSRSKSPFSFFKRARSLPCSPPFISPTLPSSLPLTDVHLPRGRVISSSLSTFQPTSTADSIDPLVSSPNSPGHESTLGESNSMSLVDTLEEEEEEEPASLSTSSSLNTLQDTSSFHHVGDLSSSSSNETSTSEIFLPSNLLYSSASPSPSPSAPPTPSKPSSLAHPAHLDSPNKTSQLLSFPVPPPLSPSDSIVKQSSPSPSVLTTFGDLENHRSDSPSPSVPVTEVVGLGLTATLGEDSDDSDVADPVFGITSPRNSKERGRRRRSSSAPSSLHNPKRLTIVIPTPPTEGQDGAGEKQPLHEESFSSFSRDFEELLAQNENYPNYYSSPVVDYPPQSPAPRHFFGQTTSHSSPTSTPPTSPRSPGIIPGSLFSESFELPYLSPDFGLGGGVGKLEEFGKLEKGLKKMGSLPAIFRVAREAPSLTCSPLGKTPKVEQGDDDDGDEEDGDSEDEEKLTQNWLSGNRYPWAMGASGTESGRSSPRPRAAAMELGSPLLLGPVASPTTSIYNHHGLETPGRTSGESYNFLNEAGILSHSSGNGDRSPSAMSLNSSSNHHSCSGARSRSNSNLSPTSPHSRNSFFDFGGKTGLVPKNRKGNSHRTPHDVLYSASLGPMNMGDEMVFPDYDDLVGLQSLSFYPKLAASGNEGRKLKKVQPTTAITNSPIPVPLKEGGGMGRRMSSMNLLSLGGVRRRKSEAALGELKKKLGVWEADEDLPPSPRIPTLPAGEPGIKKKKSRLSLFIPKFGGGGKKDTFVPATPTPVMPSTSRVGEISGEVIENLAKTGLRIDTQLEPPKNLLFSSAPASAPATITTFVNVEEPAPIVNQHAISLPSTSNSSCADTSSLEAPSSSLTAASATFPPTPPVHRQSDDDDNESYFAMSLVHSPSESMDSNRPMSLSHFVSKTLGDSLRVEAESEKKTKNGAPLPFDGTLVEPIDIVVFPVELPSFASRTRLPPSSGSERGSTGQDHQSVRTTGSITSSLAAHSIASLRSPGEDHSDDSEFESDEDDVPLGTLPGALTMQKSLRIKARSAPKRRGFKKSDPFEFDPPAHVGPSNSILNSDAAVGPVHPNAPLQGHSLLPHTDDAVVRRSASGPKSSSLPLDPLIANSTLAFDTSPVAARRPSASTSTRAQMMDILPLAAMMKTKPSLTINATASSSTATRDPARSPKSPTFLGFSKIRLPTTSQEPIPQVASPTSTQQSPRTSPPTVSRTPSVSAAVPPARSAQVLPTVERRIFVGDHTRHILVAVSATTKCGEVVEGAKARGALNFGTAAEGGFALWEICRSLGVERPIREIEFLADVIKSWDQDSNILIIRRTTLWPVLSKFLRPQPPVPRGGWVQLEVKKGKWSKRFLEVRDGLVSHSKSEKPGKDTTQLCQLSAFDVFFVASHKVESLKAPKPFVFALKSLLPPAHYEEMADYCYFVSVKTSEDLFTWAKSLTEARNTYVRQREQIALTREQSILSTSSNSSSSVANSGIGSQPAAPLIDPQALRPRSKSVRAPPSQLVAALAQPRAGEVMIKQSSAPASTSLDSRPSAPASTSLDSRPSAQVWSQMGDAERHQWLKDAERQARSGKQSFLSFGEEVNAQVGPGQAQIGRSKSGRK